MPNNQLTRANIDWIVAEKAKINRRIKARLRSNETDRRKLVELESEMSALSASAEIGPRSPRSPRKSLDSWLFSALPYAFGVIGLIIGLIVIIPLTVWLYGILPIAPSVEGWVTAGFVLLAILIIAILVMIFAFIGLRVSERRNTGR